MTNRNLAHTLGAVANQMHVVVGVTSALRRSRGADAQQLVDLERAVAGVTRVLRHLQPKTLERDT
jgi:hypothetical protein